MIQWTLMLIYICGCVYVEVWECRIGWLGICVFLSNSYQRHEESQIDNYVRLNSSNRCRFFDNYLLKPLCRGVCGLLKDPSVSSRGFHKIRLKIFSRGWAPAPSWVLKTNTVINNPSAKHLNCMGEASSSSERLAADDGDDDVPKFFFFFIVSTLIIILLLLYYTPRCSYYHKIIQIRCCKKVLQMFWILPIYLFRIYGTPMQFHITFTTRVYGVSIDARTGQAYPKVNC